MSSASTVTIARVSATSATAQDEILQHIKRDGVVIVNGMFTKEHMEQ
ncbi:unnamed protein product, partial [Rotaria sordida]